MAEKRTREPGSVGAKDDRLRAPFDPSQFRHAPPASARAVLHHRGQVADAIADQRHREIIEIGNHDFPDFAGLRWPVVHQYFHDITFRHHVMAVVRFAFVRDAGEFAASVFVENLGRERALNFCTHVVRHHLS